jgi:hypothetical protein
LSCFVVFNFENKCINVEKALQVYFKFASDMLLHDSVKIGDIGSLGNYLVHLDMLGDYSSGEVG